MASQSFGVARDDTAVQRDRGEARESERERERKKDNQALVHGQASCNNCNNKTGRCVYCCLSVVDDTLHAPGSSTMHVPVLPLLLCSSAPSSVYLLPGHPAPDYRGISIFSTRSVVGPDAMGRGCATAVVPQLIVRGQNQG